MAELSPAAQAVLHAYKLASDGRYINGEWIQDHAGQIAAALRAAADQCADGAAHWELYAIAAELEGHHA